MRIFGTHRTRTKLRTKGPISLCTASATLRCHYILLLLRCVSRHHLYRDGQGTCRDRSCMLVLPLSSRGSRGRQISHRSHGISVSSLCACLAEFNQRCSLPNHHGHDVWHSLCGPSGRRMSFSAQSDGLNDIKEWRSCSLHPPALPESTYWPRPCWNGPEAHAF